MKVLVVDDDVLVRTFFRRYFSQKFGFTVIEATNGLEGLSRIVDDAPDLVVLDLMMPGMDGIECLGIIRGDPFHKALPVIVLTATKEKEKVERLVELGISDFLLKPLESKDAYGRISKVVETIREAKEKQSPGLPLAGGNLIHPTVLLVDGDRSFRSFFVSLFSNRFVIHEARTGMEASEFLLKTRPDIVCIGEDLPMITEEMLARRLRARDPRGEMMILSCAEEEPAFASLPGLLDGWVRKSTIPEKFIPELERFVDGQQYSYNKIKKIIRYYVSGEFVRAMQITLDIGEVHVLENQDVEAKGLNILGMIEMYDRQRTCSVRVGLQGEEGDVLRVIGRVVDDGERRSRVDAIRQLVRPIGDQVRQALEAHGMSIHMDAPKVSVLQGGSKPINWSIAFAIRTKASERYIVGMTVEQHTAQQGAPALSA